MDRDAVEVLLQPADTIDRHVQEMQKLVEEVEDLEYKLDSSGQGVLSLEEIQLELNSVQRTRDTLSIEVDDLRDQHRMLNDDLSSTQVRWHTAREEKIKASNTLKIFKKAEEELVLLAKEKEQVTVEKKLLEENLDPLSKEKESLLQEYNNALKQRLDQEYHQLAERKRDFQQELDALGRLNMKIKEYVDSKRADKLNELQEKHSLSQSQLQKCEARKEDISADLNKSKELLQSQGQLKRNIDDNPNYRKTKAEVDRLTRDIESLEERVLSIGSLSTIEADLKRHAQERERLVSGVMSIHNNS
uniref:Uncharacterized protein n=1 Tax=Arundo donax TaxID=35708 RepID=A0A0A9E5P2_ARUDO